MRSLHSQLFRSWVWSANDGIKERGNQWQGETEVEGNAEFGWIDEWMNLGEWGEIWAEMLTVGKDKSVWKRRGAYMYIFFISVKASFSDKDASLMMHWRISLSLPHRHSINTWCSSHPSIKDTSPGVKATPALISHCHTTGGVCHFLTSPGGRNWLTVCHSFHARIFLDYVVLNVQCVISWGKRYVLQFWQKPKKIFSQTSNCLFFKKKVTFEIK